MASAGNFFNELSNEYYKFTASEKKVTDYVLSHKNETQFMSISELADACNVGEATISRFCRKLKLRSYNDFKLNIAKNLASGGGDLASGSAGRGDMPGHVGDTDETRIMAAGIRDTYFTALQQTYEFTRKEKIDKAVDMIMKANRVFCMGQGGSMILAQEAQHLFSTITNKFVYVQDSHLQTQTAAVMGTDDVLLYMSYSGSTKEIVDIMSLAKNGGAGIILITRYQRSPGAILADVVLQCGSNETPLELGSIPARFAQMYVLDIIFHAMYERDVAAAEEYQSKIANALTDRHI